MPQTKYKADEKRKEYSKVRNDFIKEKYDRLNLTFPKGKKEEYQAKAAKAGLSLNALINKLLEEYDNHGL